jgi:hypothetical protein
MLEGNVLKAMHVVKASKAVPRLNRSKELNGRRKECKSYITSGSERTGDVT